MPDLSRVFDLYHSSQQHQILNPPSEARDRTCILVDTSQVLNPLSHKRNSLKPVLILFGIPLLRSASSHVSYKATMRRPPFVFVFVFLPFLGPLPRHLEIPRLGVESELQLPAGATAIATRDPRRICHLHHSSRQQRNLNTLGEARD